MNKTHLALTICMTLALGACGGGSDSNVASDGGTGSGGGNNNASEGGDGTDNTGTGGAPAAGDAEFFGMVNVSDGDNSTVDMSGSFVRFGASLPFPSVEEALKPSDKCTVTQNITTPPVTSGGPDFGISTEFVSAGAAIPFTSGTGSYASMPRQSQVGFISYSQEDVPGPPPVDLTLTIPGDVYPAFANIPVPKNVPIQWLAPAQGEILTAQSALSWQPGPNPDAIVHVSAMSFDPSNPAAAKFLSCDLIDDGNHAFSAATQAAMGADFSAAGPPSASRTVTTVHRNGSAVLFVGRG